ncbi:hypothetical protein JOC86_000123 [Bacillus pakistanensis]|uniref:Uncharacterized protein n=1 Tax=Rossellomorea pakistanensis TaxID=992288 RepID=A0ABS2N7L2_9BACI|nr:hypothetical protein [Bacillus pakistanensis]MBM7583586.1 hypothetical protein [Bacillus pakistanensis]
MRRKFTKLGISIVALFTIMWSSNIVASAATNYGPYWFATGDGQWDGKFTARSGNNVRVYINDWGGTTDWVKVRLCRIGGGCTIYKAIDLGEENTTTFTNMYPGTYYGDVAKVHNPRRQIKGKISFRVY